MLMPKRVKRRKVHARPHEGQGPARQFPGLRRLWYSGARSPAGSPPTRSRPARIAMTRYIKRGGQVWIKIFPDKPITEKPAETRMGSGKGSPEYWVAVVKPGRVLFEMDGRHRGRCARGSASGGSQTPDQDASSSSRRAISQKRGGEESMKS